MMQNRAANKASICPQTAVWGLPFFKMRQWTAGDHCHCPAEGGGAHREKQGNTCGQREIVTQTVSAHLGEVQK